MSHSVRSTSVAAAAFSCGNPTDSIPDDEALQTCLDRGGIIELESGSPGYIVNGRRGDPNRGLWLTKSGTVLTSQGARARIIAGQDLFTEILRTPPFTEVNAFVIRNVAFDGMVDRSPLDEHHRRRRDECDIKRAPGNLVLQGRAFRFEGNESVHALCGSGLSLSGNFDVENNYISQNGRDKASGGKGFPWSDGITVLYCERGYIAHNVIVDNSDIDLALGGGPFCTVELNTIAHFGSFGVSGLNIGNFDGLWGGDHSYSEYRNNVVFSNVPNHLGMGISVGSHMWSTDVNVYNAGRITRNTSWGNDINLVVDGVYGGEIIDNDVHDPANETDDARCKHSSFNYTVFPPHVASTILQKDWVELRYDRGYCLAVSAAMAARQLRMRNSGQ